MIELSKHIESLLLDNDCVIVPELGGFIAHYQSAYYEEAEELFLPPIRTVGFNPQLTMNDGLLAQSYMQAYHTDYSDAMQRISEKVNVIKETLYKGDTIELHGIGSLHYNIYDEYEFHSNESGLLSPSLYGLDSFTLPLLSNELPIKNGEENAQPVQPSTVKKEIRLFPTQWIGNAVAVAIAILLFFTLSIPVENTYIDKGSYASLGTDCLFEAIRSQSMATTLTTSHSDVQVEQTQDIKPKVVSEVKVPPTAVKTVHVATEKKEITALVAPKFSDKATKVETSSNKKEIAKTTPKETPATNKKAVVVKKNRYHIIVSSLTTSADAQRMLKEYNQKGYNQATVIEGNGRFRIALCSFADKTQAYNKLNELKQEDAFKSAWMLSSK